MPTSTRRTRKAPTKRRPASASAPAPAADRTPVNDMFELRRSPIQGLGAFAIRPIRKGSRVIEYTGEKISYEEADRRYDDTKMRRHHTFLFILNNKWILDAAVGGNEARFINHSCEPNCEAVNTGRKIWIEAIRDIEEGEELLYDYQYERTEDHTPEDEEFYRCLCGARRCRGTILAPPPKRKARKPATPRKKSAGKRGRAA